MTATPETTVVPSDRTGEIRKREQAATPGPWGIYFDGVVYDLVADLQPSSTGYRCRRGIGRLDEEPIDNDPTHRDWTERDDAKQVFHDAEFVAHARRDVPFLLDRVAELEAQMARVREFATSHEYKRLHELLDG
ncbi:hypothetical protein, partial [Microbacterium tumbae]